MRIGTVNSYNYNNIYNNRFCGTKNKEENGEGHKFNIEKQVQTIKKIHEDNVAAVSELATTPFRIFLDKVDKITGVKQEEVS